jgi:hypothetical protein
VYVELILLCVLDAGAYGFAIKPMPPAQKTRTVTPAAWGMIRFTAIYLFLLP